MSDEQIKQRIKYLVEHGGIYDDPIDDLRRKVRILFYMTGAACAMGVVGVIELILLLK
jgi:hypothetical protein